MFSSKHHYLKKILFGEIVFDDDFRKNLKLHTYMYGTVLLGTKCIRVCVCVRARARAYACVLVYVQASRRTGKQDFASILRASGSGAAIHTYV